jgi:hypothetical protein
VAKIKSNSINKNNGLTWYDVTFCYRFAIQSLGHNSKLAPWCSWWQLVMLV